MHKKLITLWLLLLPVLASAEITEIPVVVATIGTNGVVNTNTSDLIANGEVYAVNLDFSGSSTLYTNVTQVYLLATNGAPQRTLLYATNSADACYWPVQLGQLDTSPTNAYLAYEKVVAVHQRVRTLTTTSAAAAPTTNAVRVSVIVLSR